MALYVCAAGKLHSRLLTALAIAVSSSFAVLTYHVNRKQKEEEESDAAHAAALCLRNPLNHIIEPCRDIP